MDEFFNPVGGGHPDRRPPDAGSSPDGDALGEIAELLGQARRPVLVLGTDVWADGAEGAALRLVEEAGLPAITNGMGRGVVPGGHPLLVTKARVGPGSADLVVVGAPARLPLGYGVWRQGRRHPGSRRAPRRLAGTGLHPRRPSRPASGTSRRPRRAARGGFGLPPARLGRLGDELQDTVGGGRPRRGPAGAEADPVHPADLRRAGPPAGRRRRRDRRRRRLRVLRRQVRRAKRPGGWLDPARSAASAPGWRGDRRPDGRPSAEIVLLLGDGAAGMSLMDVDTLVRHGLPVVMVSATLRVGAGEGPDAVPVRLRRRRRAGAQTRYDEVARAGGGEETVSGPGTSVRRSTGRSRPGALLVNVITDVEAAYPRATFGI